MRFSRTHYPNYARAIQTKITHTNIVVIRPCNRASRTVYNSSWYTYTAANKSRFPGRVDNDDSINRAVYFFMRVCVCVSACVGFS